MILVAMSGWAQPFIPPKKGLVSIKQLFSWERLAIQDTPPKFNIEPENDGLEDDFPFPVVYSQVPC